MSDLTPIEKRKLERTLGMGQGYVLGFSDRTFRDFFLDCVGIDIYDEKYDHYSGSKANRMRAFWDKESNYLVGKILGTLFEGWEEFREIRSPEEPPEDCWRILRRLQAGSSVPEIGAISPNLEGDTFEVLARSVRDSIDRNEPELGLDRLHTFLVKFFRALCEKRGMDTGWDKPLHSIVGAYVKMLQAEGLIQSDVTERILKSTISVMEEFNRVRNDQSLAHDNELLNYDESMLIFGHVTNIVRFIKSLEGEGETRRDTDHDIPF